MTDSFQSQSNGTSSGKSSLITLAETASESVHHVVQFHLLPCPYHDPESFICLPAHCLFPLLACKFHVDGDSEWAHNQVLNKYCWMNKWKKEWAKKWIGQTADQRARLLSYKFWYRFINQIFTEHLLCVRNHSRYQSYGTQQNKVHILISWYFRGRES